MEADTALPMTTQEPQASRLAIADEGPDSDLSLRSLFVTAWRGRWILLLCVGLGVVTGFRKIEEQGEIWRAQSRLFVHGKSRSPVFYEGFIGSGTYEFLGTQAAVLKSTTLLQSVAARPEVASSSILSNSPNKVAALRGGLKIDVGRDDDILTVSLTSGDVAEACVVVNTVVSEYRRMVGVRGESSIRNTLEIFEDQRERLQADLNEALTMRDAFLAENALVALDPEGAGQFEIKQLNEFRGRLVEAERAAEEAKARLAEAELLRGDIEVLRLFVSEGKGFAPTATADPEFLDLIADIDEAEDELERLSAQRSEGIRVLKMTPRHAAIVELDARIS